MNPLDLFALSGNCTNRLESIVNSPREHFFLTMRMWWNFGRRTRLRTLGANSYARAGSIPVIRTILALTSRACSDDSKLRKQWLWSYPALNHNVTYWKYKALAANVADNIRGLLCSPKPDNQSPRKMMGLKSSSTTDMWMLMTSAVVPIVTLKV